MDATSATGSYDFTAAASPASLPVTRASGSVEVSNTSVSVGLRGVSTAGAIAYGRVHSGSIVHSKIHETHAEKRTRLEELFNSVIKPLFPGQKIFYLPLEFKVQYRDAAGVLVEKCVLQKANEKLAALEEMRSIQLEMDNHLNADAIKWYDTDYRHRGVPNGLATLRRATPQLAKLPKTHIEFLELHGASILAQRVNTHEGLEEDVLTRTQLLFHLHHDGEYHRAMLNEVSKALNEVEEALKPCEAQAHDNTYHDLMKDRRVLEEVKTRLEEVDMYAYSWAFMQCAEKRDGKYEMRKDEKEAAVELEEKVKAALTTKNWRGKSVLEGHAELYAKDIAGLVIGDRLGYQAHYKDGRGRKEGATKQFFHMRLHNQYADYEGLRFYGLAKMTDGMARRIRDRSDEILQPDSAEYKRAFSYASAAHQKGDDPVEMVKAFIKAATTSPASASAVE